ncbi:hypothetical protein DESUT3_16360 [Desulfuromonas versatilis]|uniref:Transcription factor zinc-finger domain-containing protein n=1 Tax=Desulfuromonas versatilis TaxID=2802975 RepID=A0ABN6DXL4_9BACT|nr:hypothetical protein [Desulfuromonas versatilis]BCR04567.1 hypothetical protein DESUT3_16360 [Desulfuromonas versatilis]
MTETRCSECNSLFPEDELLIREDDGKPVCEDCSGLITGEDLGCQYEETG